MGVLTGQGCCRPLKGLNLISEHLSTQESGAGLRLSFPFYVCICILLSSRVDL